MKKKFNIKNMSKFRKEILWLRKNVDNIPTFLLPVIEKAIDEMNKTLDNELRKIRKS